MSEWFALRDSLYFLHAQIKLWSKAEDLRLLEPVQRVQTEQVRRTCDMILFVCRSFVSQAMKERSLVSVQRLLSLTLGLLTRRRNTVDNFASGELQQYIDELQQLQKIVETKMQQQAPVDQLGVSELEMRELFRRPDSST